MIRTLPEHELLALASLASPQVWRGEPATGLHQDRFGQWLVLDARLGLMHVQWILLQRVQVLPAPAPGIPVRGLRDALAVPLASWLVLREYDAHLVNVRYGCKITTPVLPSVRR